MVCRYVVLWYLATEPQWKVFNAELVVLCALHSLTYIDAVEEDDHSRRNKGAWNGLDRTGE